MDAEHKEFYDSLSDEDKELFNEILSDTLDLFREYSDEEEAEAASASEGVLIKRMNWTTMGVIDKKVSKTCVLLAKANADPLYKKFKFFRDKWRFWREKIRQKYGGRARSIVLSNGGVNATDLGVAVNKALHRI
jgi:hypothetical protein